MLNRWLENEPKGTLICAVASAVSLVLNITGALKGILPFDIAWVAIILCGIPILVGAFKGVVFEHDRREHPGGQEAGRYRVQRHHEPVQYLYHAGGRGEHGFIPAANGAPGGGVQGEQSPHRIR